MHTQPYPPELKMMMDRLAEQFGIWNALQIDQEKQQAELQKQQAAQNAQQAAVTR